jgi:hydrogenase maturation protease
VTAPTLVFTWGNPSRGDDALGPLVAERLQQWQSEDATAFEVLTDFQLQIEHALDLRDRSRILFVDAAVDCAPPFAVSRVVAARDRSFTSHAMTPQSLLHVYRELQGEAPPPAWQLAIRGVDFTLGNGLTPAAEEYLEQALRWIRAWSRMNARESYNGPQTMDCLRSQSCQ